MNADLADYLATQRRRIEAALNRVLPVPPACPTSVAEAMRYSLLAGGKRLRPILTLAAADAVTLAHPDASLADRAYELAMPAACAIEMIHTYSLIHDDLPAMDNDTMRRGRPTVHVVFGEAIAILAGDGLLTEAFALLVREPVSSDPHIADRKLRTIRCVAEAAGPQGMVGGQAIDLANEPLDADGLRVMYGRKTGALLRAAAVAGAIMAGGDARATQAIDGYATDLGLAFQIVDDVLDVEGSADQLGKTTGKDAAAGKRTYPAAFGVDASRRMAHECVHRAKQALGQAGVAGWLPHIADWVVDREN